MRKRLADVLERINSGILSRRKAARELCIGYATLKRIIDAQKDEEDGSVDSLLASVLGNCNDKIEVLN
jgi:hypothetical protein